MARAVDSPRSILSPRDLARALGVSESSVKRWVDDGALEAVRTSGGHRRIAIAEAARFIRKMGTPVVRPEVLTGATLPIPSSGPGTTGAGEAAERLWRALASDQSHAGGALLLSLVLAGWPLASLFDGPVREALARIGEEWQHHSKGIVVEHRATDTCLAALNSLRTLLPPADADAPIALGGAPSGDPYLLPSLMASIVCLEQGFADHNLGPDTPREALAAAANHFRPKLIWISSSAVAQSRRELRRTVETLASIVQPWEGVVVFGGRTLSPFARLPGNAHYLASMAELAAFTRGLRASERSVKKASA